MSIHRSLVTKSSLKRHRNVLTRAERVKELEDAGKLGEDDTVFGLPKVRVRRVKAGGRSKKAAKAAAAERAASEEAKGAPAQADTD